MAARNFEFDIEDMKCDNCFKYLSVKPIKDYEDGTVRCGRCSQEDDEGTISMLNCYDEKQLFKCHNRYSGCRQLLSSSQVRAHEESCVTYTYNCPYCPDTVLPTYLLEDHFKKFHSLLVLKKSTFHPSCDVDKQVFFYKLNDFYFFVECTIDGNLGQFRVESYALGDPNITVNFTITSEVFANLEVLDELHVPNNRQAIHLANSADRNWPFLTVNLTYKVDDIPYYVDDALALDADLPESTATMDEFRNVMAYENFQTICTRFGIDWPVKFDINDFPQNMFLSSDFLHVIRLKKWIGTEIYLHCYKCFINSCHGRVPGDFVKINCTLFFLCEICCEIERKEGKVVNYTGYINIFKNFKAKYPRNFDCDVIYKQLPDFEDSPEP
ncbi:unnamed protein product [Phyllotreta striolata]|uniref:C2H2-type domain-containing protein n=1 Tax=Phyllotreta striolata TaxID=444603 RepID=A0A9N9TR45_PHYSR|nr:unnamed protein product [Phyllotreta striolata]